MKQCQKSSIIGQEEKALTFVFTPYLITSVKVLFLEGKLGTGFYLYPLSIFIKCFRIFQDPKFEALRVQRFWL